MLKTTTLMIFLLCSASCGLFSKAPEGGGTGGSTTSTQLGGGTPDSGPGNNANTNVGNPNTQIAYTGPITQFVGRFDTTDSATQPLMGWPGSTVLTRFSGTQLAVQIRATSQADYNDVAVNNLYDVYVDNGNAIIVTMNQSQTNYPVISGLQPGIHTVRLVKRTESQIGVDQFMGFVTDGTLLPTAAPAERRIEIIGDSISAGFGIDGDTASCPFTPATENYDQTYASLTAQSFGADLHDIAYSGKGVYRNVDPQEDPVNTMPVLYPLVIAESTATWDFTKWIPQVVVINLGSNDFNAPGDVDIAAFTSAYQNLVTTVRGHYPQAAIFLTEGPVLVGSSMQACADAIQQVVANAGPNVYYVQYATDTGTNGYGCQGHPNVTTQKMMAGVLTSAISAQVGWSAIPQD